MKFRGLEKGFEVRQSSPHHRIWDKVINPDLHQLLIRRIGVSRRSRFYFRNQFCTIFQYFSFPQINPQHKSIRDISYLKHRRRLFELVAVLGRSERSDGRMLIHAVDEHSLVLPKQQIPGSVPREYPSDSVTTSVRKDSIPRHW